MKLVRMPSELSEKLRDAANSARRSINSEILIRLESIDGPAPELGICSRLDATHYIRLTPRLKQLIKAAAAKAHRSSNSEIVARLNSSFASTTTCGDARPAPSPQTSEPPSLQFKTRLPANVAEWLEQSARKNGRTMTAEIVQHLQRAAGLSQTVTIAYLDPGQPTKAKGQAPKLLPRPTTQGAAKLSYNMDELLAATGMNRNQVYAAITAGELKTFKVGKRRMTSHQAILDYIARREAAL